MARTPTDVMGLRLLFTTAAPPKKSPFFTDEKRPPLGLGFLMAMSRDKGHEVFFKDNYLKPTNFIEQGFLQKNDIDIVGIQTNTICFRDALRIMNALEQLRKDKEWNGKIVVGGPHTSVALKTIPSFVDHVVLGEGERAFMDILEGKAQERVMRAERIKDLDQLPFQPWDVFTAMPYDYSCRWMDEKPVFTMNTSRGCPFNCAFCSVGSIWGRKYTYFSAKRTLDEITFLVEKHKAKGIYFREDNFTLNMKRTREFCKLMKDSDLDVGWACETRVDNMKDEIIKMMADAGCKAFYLGVESGSQRILDIVNKKIDINEIERTITLGKKYGIRSYCSLITGVPGETYEDYMMTKKLMERLKPYEWGFNVFVGIPYSDLYKKVIEEKLYEYMDDIGLAYLPGYDVKAEFFYNVNCDKLVDHKFKGRTEYDKRLLKELPRKRLKSLPFKAVRAIKKVFKD